jgi:hypothetical protein
VQPYVLGLKEIEAHAVTRVPKLACGDPNQAEIHTTYGFENIFELNFMPFGQEP